MSQTTLQMTFDPNTIEHLGARMYSTLPPVLSELVANAHDADAEHVVLTLKDINGKKEIIVEDDGVGMSFDEINDRFLKIGRNRRTEERTNTTPKGRQIIGKKGLGKLSFFGIAHEIEIDTQKDGKRNVFQMKWEDIKKSTKAYEPQIVHKNKDCSPNKHGIKITLRNMQRKTDFDPNSLANSLSKIFIVDTMFEVSIRHNTEKPIVVSNTMRYAGLQIEVEWKIPDDCGYRSNYNRANKISGYLMTATKPIPTNVRGIVLFSRKKMVNQPEFFSDSTSSHFFSYLAGFLEVDFIDDLEDDVIATNRQSLNWGHEETQKLRTHLRGLIGWMEKDWRDKRNRKRKKNLNEKTGIDIPKWFSTLPNEIRPQIDLVIQIITQDSELTEGTSQKAIKAIHDIVPEYPKYHWRHLHRKVQNASETDYKKQDYYRAFQEAVKRYINEVKTKSEITEKSDQSMMGQAFGNDRGSILQVAKVKKLDGDYFSDTTRNNIEDGQKFLSMGVVSGCRNPVCHEEIVELRDSGLFREQDCLDALSLLSHLFYRLDNSKKIKGQDNLSGSFLHDLSSI